MRKLLHGSLLIVALFMNPCARAGLHDAIVEGDARRALELARKSKDFDRPDDKMQVTPLFLASFKGQMEVATVLISRGARVNFKTPQQRTPLHAAASRGDHALTQLLLDKGAEVNAVDIDGATALEEAAAAGNPDTVSLLLASGSKVDGVPPNRFTPLMAACLGKANPDQKVEIAKLLLEKEADVRLRRFQGCTALHFAAIAGTVPVAALLVERGADLSATGDAGRSPLLCAAMYDREDFMAFLVTSGAKPTTATNLELAAVTEVLRRSLDGDLSLKRDQRVSLELAEGAAKLHRYLAKGAGARSDPAAAQRSLTEAAGLFDVAARYYDLKAKKLEDEKAASFWRDIGMQWLGEGGSGLIGVAFDQAFATGEELPLRRQLKSLADDTRHRAVQCSEWAKECREQASRQMTEANASPK
jgi:ankyrin repeat protein